MLSLILRGALVVYAGICLLALWFGWLEIELLTRALDQPMISGAEDHANESRQLAVGSLFVVWYLLTAFLFLRWTFTVVAAASKVGDAGSPWLAIGWHFVPVANLLMPYVALRRAVRVMEPEDSAIRLLPAWWTVWLASNALGGLAFWLARESRSIAEARDASIAALAADASNLALAWILFALVASIQARVNATTAGRPAA